MEILLQAAQLISKSQSIEKKRAILLSRYVWLIAILVSSKKKCGHGKTLQDIYNVIDNHLEESNQYKRSTSFLLLQTVFKSTFSKVVSGTSKYSPTVWFHRISFTRSIIGKSSERSELNGANVPWEK